MKRFQKWQKYPNLSNVLSRNVVKETPNFKSYLESNLLSKTETRFGFLSFLKATDTCKYFLHAHERWALHVGEQDSMLTWSAFPDWAVTPDEFFHLPEFLSRRIPPAYRYLQARFRLTTCRNKVPCSLGGGPGWQWPSDFPTATQLAGVSTGIRPGLISKLTILVPTRPPHKDKYVSPTDAN